MLLSARSRRLLPSLVLAGLVTLPCVAFGAELINGGLSADSYCWTNTGGRFGSADCEVSIFGLFAKIVEYIIVIASILAAMFFMYAGWLYLSSAGDTSKIEQAHKIFKDVGWGFVLLLAAWLIVVSILEALGAKPWLLQFFGRG